MVEVELKGLARTLQVARRRNEAEVRCSRVRFAPGAVAALDLVRRAPGNEPVVIGDPSR